MAKASHSKDSSLREQYLEYLFIGALSQEMWKRGIPMDVLKSHTDRSGYDVVLDANDIQRHVQLKSSFLSAKTARQKINIGLTKRPAGCVVWILFKPIKKEIDSFLWLGNGPKEPLEEEKNLGTTVAKHSRGDRHGVKKERPDIRVVPKKKFKEVKNIKLLADRLFGEVKPKK